MFTNTSVNAFLANGIELVFVYLKIAILKIEKCKQLTNINSDTITSKLEKERQDFVNKDVLIRYQFLPAIFQQSENVIGCIN